MASAAVVARTKLHGLEYLTDSPLDAWSEASHLAVRFSTIREATRAAMRLPSRFRAFALPAPGGR
jgi:hypothetical protein